MFVVQILYAPGLHIMRLWSRQYACSPDSTLVVQTPHAPVQKPYAQVRHAHEAVTAMQGTPNAAGLATTRVRDRVRKSIAASSGTGAAKSPSQARAAQRGVRNR